MRRVALTAVALFTFAVPLFAQKQFSAEFVDSGKDSEFHRAKIYVGDHKMRIEPEGERANSPMSPTAIVMDGTGQNSFAVIDSQHMVVQNIMNATHSPLLPEAMASIDLNDPCGSINRWHEEHQTRSKNTHLSNCKNLGNENVNGRNATKWQATNEKGQTGYFWLDPELRYMIKIDSADGGHLNLENIKVGSQPASLFEPPAGYRVMNMQQVMQEQMGRRR